MKTILLLLAAAFFFSCKNDLNYLHGEKSSNTQYAGILDEDLDPDLIDYYDSFWLRDTLVRGDFSIGETNYLVDNSYENEFSNTSMTGVVYSGNLTPEYTQNVTENGPFMVCGVDVPYLSDHMRYLETIKGHLPIWGTRCEISLGNSTYPGFNMSMYFPQSMRIISPFISMEELYTHSIHLPLRVQWNADIQNDKGVIILVSSSGPNPFDPDSEASHQNIKRYLVKDDGEVTLPADAFSDIPVGNFANIGLSRCNFAFIPNSDQTDFYGFSASTSTSISIKLGE